MLRIWGRKQMINVNNSGDVHELHFPKLMDKNNRPDILEWKTRTTGDQGSLIIFSKYISQCGILNKLRNTLAFVPCARIDAIFFSFFLSFFLCFFLSLICSYSFYQSAVSSVKFQMPVSAQELYLIVKKLGE